MDKDDNNAPRPAAGLSMPAGAAWTTYRVGDGPVMVLVPNAYPTYTGLIPTPLSKLQNCLFNNDD